jgi:hypothetical protein
MRPALPRRGRHSSRELLECLGKTPQDDPDPAPVDNTPYADVCTIDCKLAMVVYVRRRVRPSSRAMPQESERSSRR